MGDILILVGIAGLILTAAATPIVVVTLRRKERKLSERIQQEYE